jgi:large subunit ribosomal protein L22
MTPTTPGDPQKGKVDEAKVEEEAKEAKTTPVEAEAQPEPKAKPEKAKAKAKPAAAEATGVDKEAAEATEAKPTKAKVKASARNPEGTKPEGTKAKAAAAAAEGEIKEAAAKQPAKRDRRRRPEPGVLVRAQAKYVRTSARKARLVCDHIRGKDVAEARAILAYTPRAAAKAWIKLLESAVANAEHNHELVGEDLRIAAVHADEGPTLKRYRPRAMGRATRIRKRTSHLTITLTPKES